MAQETKELKPYVVQIRTELILIAKEKGLSLQDISDMFSKPINRSRVHAIIKKESIN